MAAQSRRRTRRTNSIGAMLLTAILAAAGWLWHQWRDAHSPALPEAQPPAAASLADGRALAAHVERVVDGDTLLLADGHRTRVRLIGVNTPETVKPNHPVEPWGPEASDFTKRFLSSGEIVLEFDGPRQDRYGRTLAYVWVGQQMLNEELLRAGLGHMEPNYTYSAAVKDRFAQAEDEARAAHRGLWSR